MTKITGVRKHAQRLKSAADMARTVTQGLYAAGQEIETDAEHSIVQGSVSGAGHVPSAPGQPPNRDSGDLDRNIDTEIITQNPPTVHVTSHMPYSAALEFGTSKMIERPFMRPATEKNRQEVGRKVAQAVRLKIRRGS